MNEILHWAFSPANMVPTFLLLFVLLFWLISLLGAFDVGGGDLDVDIDIDVDVDVDADLDMDADMEGGGFSLKGILGFLNLGKAPFMLVLSIWVLFLWGFTVSGNYLLNNHTWWIGLLLMIPMLVPSALIAKILTEPFKSAYAEMNKGEGRLYLRGEIGIVSTTPSEKGLGQASIFINGRDLLILIRAETPGTLRKGMKVVFTERLEGEDEVYLVTPIETEPD